MHGDYPTEESSMMDKENDPAQEQPWVGLQTDNTLVECMMYGLLDKKSHKALQIQESSMRLILFTFCCVCFHISSGSG